MKETEYLIRGNLNKAAGAPREPEVDHDLGEKEIDLDDGNRRVCDMCTLPIFSTPYKTEEVNGCRVFRHKCCANLPRVLTDHQLHPRRPLYLHNNNLPADGRRRDDDDVLCNKCTRKCRGFIYQCPDEHCVFTLDILCAAATVKIVHRSHKHELALFRRRENRFRCAACGLEHEGEFYVCDVCGFYLHRDCALLPNAILHKKHSCHNVDADADDGQQHPLVLSYAFPENALKFKTCRVCCVCKEDLLSASKSGIYFCTKCDYVTHIKCSISKAADDIDDFRSVSIAEATSKTLIHLPMIEDHDTCLVQYLLLDKDKDKQWCNEGRRHLDKVLIEKIHDHELILYENYDNTESENDEFLQCNACLYLIYPPFYSCPQCTNFHLHKCCAHLPLQFDQHSMHYLFGRETCRDRPLDLLPRVYETILCHFRCSGCALYNNGFLYGCKDCSVRLELNCAMLPEAITYEKHGNSHILLLSFGSLPRNSNLCHCCKGHLGQPEWEFYYECCSCPNFKLHAFCALMPLSIIVDKHDRHPLKLTLPPQLSTTTTNENHDNNFCEICEEAMDARSWCYHCEECVTWFHMGRCMRFVGGLKQIKLGETIRVGCHVDCPLTSIGMLSNYSYTCGLCKETIPGKTYSVAFKCSKCGYWLHGKCAQKEWIANC